MAPVPPPTTRDPLWFSPVFVLAPARTNSTVVATMLGVHPELHGFPELALFRRDTVAQIITDPPNWKGAPARLRLAGLLRAIAQVHDGEQSEPAIQSALAWLEDRRAWPVGCVMDELLRGVAPLVGLEKSPENSSHGVYLRRLDAAFPRARYIHLTRHPIPSISSMHKHWHALGFWNIEPELFHHFCTGVWMHQHRRIADWVDGLPADRAMRVRSEDVLNDPMRTLPSICRWLGIDSGPEALDAMIHPEHSPNARIGPPNATGGGDTGFLRDPTLRTTPVPAAVDLPEGWNVDPWLWLTTVELAARLGYGAASGPTNPSFVSAGG